MNGAPIDFQAKARTQCDQSFQSDTRYLAYAYRCESGINTLSMKGLLRSEVHGLYNDGILYVRICAMLPLDIPTRPCRVIPDLLPSLFSHRYRAGTRRAPQTTCNIVLDNASLPPLSNDGRFCRRAYDILVLAASNRNVKAFPSMRSYIYVTGK